MSGRLVAISASFSVRFLHLEFVSESVERNEFLIFDKFTGHVKKLTSGGISGTRSLNGFLEFTNSRKYLAFN